MSEEIKNILMDHKGKKNVITSKQISEIMGFPMEDTQSVSRKAIWNTAQEYGLPLISCNKGFFIAETDDELEAYKNNIQKRICGMKKTRDMAIKNYKKWKSEQ